MTSILRIAIPSPLRHSFDYLPPVGCESSRLVPGVRVKVPFGRSTLVGVLLETVSHSRIEGQRLKHALAVLDDEPLLCPDILAFLLWASAYYHHPLGDVILNALPALLRQGHAAHARYARFWRLTEAGAVIDPEQLARAPRQAELLNLLWRHPEGLGATELAGGCWHAVLKNMIAKGWIEGREALGPAPAGRVLRDTPPSLNADQHEAVEAVAAVNGFHTWLLDGVTGSGKTEVYLRIIEKVIAEGRQVLVLVPEIGLTPQLVERFEKRFAMPVALLHSTLSDQERLNAWLMARDGRAGIVIGTRSAVFTPLKDPGIFIIDEEHDLSFKQQDGFRYHARDVAIMRAQRVQVPVLLGSATPSLETLYNVEQGRYRCLVLPVRAGGAHPPRISVVDVRHRPMEDNLSRPLLDMIKEHIERDEQVLLFLNRRGFAPTLLCHDCGWVATCERCSAHMVLHRHLRNRLRCHHCGAERAMEPYCPFCSRSDLRALGHGTERVEQALARHFPDVAIVRIDRDSTRRKGAMQSLLDSARAGGRQILIGTQMISKGHHLPSVTLVGILNADQGLFGTDFRGGERMAQMIVQVAGRAGRSERPGRVVIQTHHPDHPLLRLLITQGYQGFAKAVLVERKLVELPPYACIALLRAEAAKVDAPQTFLRQAREQAEALAADKVQLWGPVAAPMERRAGRYRAQLMLQAAQRPDLHRLLKTLIPYVEGLKLARRVRWSLDVDAMEMD